jgi:hypothetical protein
MAVARVAARVVEVREAVAKAAATEEADMAAAATAAVATADVATKAVRVAVARAVAATVAARAAEATAAVTAEAHSPPQRSTRPPEAWHQNCIVHPAAVARSSDMMLARRAVRARLPHPHYLVVVAALISLFTGSSESVHSRTP